MNVINFIIPLTLNIVKLYFYTVLLSLKSAKIFSFLSNKILLIWQNMLLIMNLVLVNICQ